MVEVKTTNRNLSAIVARLAPWFPVVLFLLAIIYYSSYALSGLDLNGEGGTIAVVADRIRHGYRPIVDTFLGYNLLWFYPIVWLFRIFGPNFVLVRVFFFVLSAVTALFAYRTVLRATSRPLLGLTVGVILVLIPGIQFRNYLPFLGVTDLMVILEGFALPHRNRRTRFIWILLAALVVSATFLFRVDLGLFFSVVLIAAAFAYLLLGSEPLGMRLQALLAALLLLPLTFLTLHLPVGYYAGAHGFTDAFWNQYTAQIIDMDRRVLRLLPQSSVQKPTPPVVQPTPQQTRPPATELTPTENNDRSNRPLPPWTQMFTSRWGKTRILVFLIYYPLVAGSIIGGAALLLAVRHLSQVSRQGMLVGRGSRRAATESLTPSLGSRDGTDSLVLGITLASAFTLFPQYFFFRPDPQHVSEMMSVFLVTLGCAFGIVLDRFHSVNRTRRVLLIAWIALSLLHVYLYCDYGLAVPWMGSIARKRPNEVWFKADNGVIALLPAVETEETRQLYEVIKGHSNRKDYVVCLPYAPTINFMTDRRSYLYNLYIDNVTRPPHFDAKAIAEIEKYRPAAICINDDPMNVVNASRFSVWAAPTMAYIRQHYRYAGTFRRNEVYLSPDK
jgi:hypothetical protein